ncbi:MFS transporter [Streptomyces echinoruber]|uniref:MFS transporter n=2 Tax=Streptomyces echinoruber TaxID=68898 RepID=A0A918VPT6_9ACTN|nr:MFS transporter [Streptomyces echinoruber]
MTRGNRPLTRVLRDRNARLCLTATVVSGFGTSALWLASGVWVRELTGSDGRAALCLVAMWAPVLAGPALGTVADRVRRRPLLVGVNLGLAVLLCALLAVDAPGRVWVVYGVLLVYGAAGVVHDAAQSALVAAAVDPALLGDLNGLRTTATEGMKLLAPLAGAGLYTAYGGAGVALLDAGTFVAAAGLYALLRVREPAVRAAGDRPRAAEGVRYLWGHARLRPLVLAGGATMLWAGVNGALVYAVVDGLGHAPAYAGVLYAVQGAGSVAAGVAAGPALRRLGERRFAACGIALTGVAVAARAVPSDAVALAGSALIGAGLPCVLVAAFTAVQHAAPDRLRGRAAATATTLVFVPNVVGLAAGAGLVELLGPRWLLPALGAALLLTPLLLRQRPAGASRTASRSASDANPA